MHLRNGSYKTVRVTPDMNCSTLAKLAAEKFNIDPQYVPYVSLFESKQGTERRVSAGENVFSIRQKWPHILDDSGNGTLEKCFFVVCYFPLFLFFPDLCHFVLHRASLLCFSLTAHRLCARPLHPTRSRTTLPSSDKHETVFFRIPHSLCLMVFIKALCLDLLLCMCLLFPEVHDVILTPFFFFCFLFLFFVLFLSFSGLSDFRTAL